MKALRLKKMILLCEKEKSARTIDFHPKVTLITGNNDTGKSSVIKSIYETFGCEIENTTNWKRLDIVSYVEFEVSGKPYIIVYSKKPRWFFLAEKNNVTGGQLCTSVTNELSVALSSLLDFRLELTTKKSTRTKALPAFIFMPFYIDQDKGWVKTFNSFERIDFFDDWKVDMIDYYVGRKKPSYFPLKTEKINLEIALQGKKQRYGTEREILEGFFNTLQPQDVVVNLEDFQSEIAELERTLNDLLSQRAALRNEIGEQSKRLSLVVNELRIAQQIMGELGHDYDFSIHSANSDGLDCPTCGAHYDNDLVNRFRLINDHEKAKGIVEKLQEEESELRKEQEELRQKVSECDSQYATINKSLREHRAAVSVKQVFEERARREVGGRVQRRVEDQQTEMAGDQLLITKKESDLDALVDREKSISVLEAYRKYLQQALQRLQVNNYSESVLKRLDASVKGSGSDQPRALLAYSGAILKCIKDNSSAAMMPLIIDSPKQQDQDPANELKMFEFIKDSLGVVDQLVLGSVDIPSGVNFGDHNLFNFSHKSKVLRPDDYDAAASVLSPILMEVELRLDRTSGSSETSETP